MYGADQQIAAGLITRSRQNVATVKEFQRSRAFHRAAIRYTVEAAFVVAADAPRAFGDVEDDAFGSPENLIAKIGSATHLTEGS